MPSNNPLPAHEANLFKKILKSYEQKQYKKSLQYAKEIMKKFPDHGETLSMKGLILNYCNKKAEAYECAQKGLKNDLKSHVCWHVYGLIQRSDRKYDEAIKCYRNALKCDPENLQILRDLSLLQIQIRDLEGFRDTRYQLLQLRPTQRVSWIGYAMSYHLLKDYEIANSILEEFCKTQPKTVDIEQSELLLYQNMVYREAEMYEDALKHLEENSKYILDKLKLEEIKAESLLKLNQKEKAMKVLEELIERNPDNQEYYKKLEECHDLKIDEKLEFYKKYCEKFPRSDAPRKLPLGFVTDEKLLTELFDAYLKRAIRKGVPPLFKAVKQFLKVQKKMDIIEKLVTGYVRNLTTSERFDENGSGEKEPPTCLLWSYYFLAQLYDYKGEYKVALEFIDKAIEHTPTLVDLYIIKGKICKHCGSFYEAVKCLDEAQSLDTADRFINYKCSKYMLRANLVKESLDIASKFTRESTHPADYLKEMQCMWFETESANAYRRLKKFGESLKKSHQVERHFQEFIEDQFDFHSYCMRKMTLCSYVDMLRLEDRIKDHPFFFKAATTAVQVYLTLHDHPLSDAGDDSEANLDNLSPSELKKLKNKQKKQQIKAQIEKDKQAQLEQKKKELSKQKNKEDGGDPEQLVEEELVPEKLEKPENPLEESMRFLKPIEEFCSNNIDTNYLAFEVYYRKNRVLLMLKALKRIDRLEKNVTVAAKFHYCLCKFLKKYQSVKSTLNQVVVNVIDRELAALAKRNELNIDSVDKLNESFVKKNSSSYESVIEAAKIWHDLDAEKNKDKIVELLLSVDKLKPSVKIAIDVFELAVKENYFGVLDEQVSEKLRGKMSTVYPYAIAFKTSEERDKELQDCLASLSLNTQSTSNEVADKLSSVSLK